MMVEPMVDTGLRTIPGSGELSPWRCLLASPGPIGRDFWARRACESIQPQRRVPTSGVTRRRSSTRGATVKPGNRHHSFIELSSVAHATFIQCGEALITVESALAERLEPVRMQHPRILVVDDDPKVLSLMQRGLTFEGYTVDLAADGDEALATAHDRPPHLVVLDVMMPGLDGLDVCRRMRVANRDLAILMLTGRASVPARIEGFDAGADDYLVKPFAFDELLARIR